MLDQEPDPDPHQFTDDKQKCREYVPIWALFQEFEPLFGSQDLASDQSDMRIHNTAKN